MAQPQYAYTPTQTPIRFPVSSPVPGPRGEVHQQESTLTRKQAVLNIFNCSVGVGLLAKPYAFAVGGWIAIPALCAACALCIYTALLIGRITEEYVKYRTERHIMRYHTSDFTLSNPNTTEKPKSDELRTVTTITASGKHEYDCSQLELLKRVHSTKAFDDNSAAYPLIAKFSIGYWGKPITILAIYLMLVTLFCVAIVTTWTLVIELIEPLIGLISNDSSDDNINVTLLFVIVCLISLPTSLALSWNELTGLAYLSIMSVGAIALSVIGLMVYCMIEFNMQPPYLYYNWTFDNSNSDSSATTAASNSHAMNKENTAAQLNAKQPFSVLVSFALFVMGISSHIALPMIHMHLENRNEWRSVVFMAFGLIGAFYMAIGAIGFWLFGEFTSIIILSNFFVWPGGVLPVIVSVLVILNLWSSFGIVIALLAELPEKELQMDSPMDSTKRRALRLGMFMVLCAMGFFFRYRLPFIETLQGILSVVLSGSLTIPIVCYIGCFHKEMTYQSIVFHCILLLFALCLGAGTFYIDVKYLY